MMSGFRYRSREGSFESNILQFIVIMAHFWYIRAG